MAPRDAGTGTGARPHRGAPLALALVLVVGTPALALAEPCPLTDPACLSDEAQDTVGDVPEVVVDQVERTVEGTQETVEQTADAIVKETEKVLDGLLGGGGGTDPGPDPDPGRKKDGPRKPRARRSTQSREPSAPSRPPVFREPGIGFVTDSHPGEAGPRTPDARRDGFIGETARHLAFPVALAALLVLFLAVQHRLDRRDPRLALAPLGPDFLAFE